jgi:ketosteroid isomerase-like protein
MCDLFIRVTGLKPPSFLKFNIVLMRQLFLLYLIVLTGSAGNVGAQPLNELVAAEKAFAKRSTESSTREAFIAYLSDSGYIFQKEPVKGKAFWEAASAGTDLLSWEPVFAAIAAAGDIGYTTGPWTFRPNRRDTSAAAGGYYVSLWRKEHAGWKVVLDIGTSFPLPQMKKESFHLAKPATVRSEPDPSTGREVLLEKEREFVSEVNRKGLTAYPAFLKENARIYRPGQFPLLTNDEHVQHFQETDKVFKYVLTDGAISLSGDLGYVFGKAEIAITKDGSTRTIIAHYLRIWEKDAAGIWKIALDLISPAR